MSLLQDFSGGLNTRVAPSLLQPNEAQVYTNIDNSAGSIRPIKDKTLVGAGSKYFTYFYAGAEFISKATETSYAEYRDKLYYTNTRAQKRLASGAEYNLGIDEPTGTPSIAISGTSSMSGTYSYAYTYYNSALGIESAPTNISNELVVTNQGILVSSITASADTQVDTIRLYRIGGSITDFTLVIELGNATATYTDTIADIDLAGNHVLDSYTNLPPPNSLKYLTLTYAMLFGVVGDKLYYSDIGTPDYWPATNFIDFDADITGIGAVPNGLIVFTRFKTFVITGNSPSTFTKYLLSGEQGCESHYTIQYVANSLMWVSADGICATSGGDITIVSQQKLGKIDFGTLNNAQVFDRVYYLSTDTEIIAFDFRYNPVVRKIQTSCGWLGTFNDKLYAFDTASIYEMFTGAALEYSWKSAVLTEGGYSNYKVFKDFYIKYNGNINVKVYVDGTLVGSKDLTGDTCYNMKVLNSAKGYGLEIELTGTGEVSEIEYKAMGRQNGR